ncbi:hypothetical protein QUF90_20635 [Desulfococcaceae bacterium HSG9]|nr:hypothetical protein [Desulfococcaceae bacterium HSG9]
MGLNSSDREMIQDITSMGMRAAVLLKGVILRKVDRNTLEWGLQELAPADLMGKYCSLLTNRSEYVSLLNTLFLVYTLEGQLDYQISEYGMDSLKDDLQEINFSLQQIGDVFDLAQLKQVI